MRIVFDGYKTGWGNNGGTRTLIRCAETLSLLGHEVVMFSNYKNGYTWHNPAGILFVRGNELPKCDVVVATGYHSAKHAKQSNADRKFYYIRGFELWQATEDKLFNSYHNINCVVNSQWLHDHLAFRGVKSEIIYPGLDFEWFSDLGKNRKNTLGGLFHTRHKTKKHGDVEKAASISGYKSRMVNKDISNVDSIGMRDFYNKIRVWMSPTENEGLHNCPMEASLCGCAIVVTDHPRSGTQDYCIHEETALVYPAGEVKAAVVHINRLMKDNYLKQTLVSNMQRLLRKKIGTRPNNMKKLVELFEGKCNVQI